tara:strand:+ start:854 stop:985 length:132 start_codon:yes stop_codon:yes gene_type:complete
MERSLTVLMIGFFERSSFSGGCCALAPDEVESNDMENNSEQAK